jgi:hypothetical protein
VVQTTKESVPNATLVHTYQLPGASNPRVCDFDDMTLRVVKWHPSAHGLTATYSELVASRLGQLIEAPVVRGTVVYVEPELLPPELTTQAAHPVTQPFHVGFTYSPGKGFRSDDYAQIKNTMSLPAAAVQLAWLQVEDQEGEDHNQYLYQLEQVLPDKTTRKMNHFIVVDQAAICGTHDWSTATPQPSALYNLPSHLKSRVSMEAMEPVLDNVMSLDEEEIRSCFSSYPDGWDIKDHHINKVTEFVLERRDHLADVLRNNLV